MDFIDKRRNIMDKMYTAEEVAELLKCSLTFVYEHKGELGAVKIGTLIRFPESKLRESFNVNMEEREQMVLQVPLAGRVDLESKRVRQPTGRAISASRKARGLSEDEKDPFGLFEALRESITRTQIKKGSLLLVR
jgi:excisionase family DNA binding protein